MSQKFKDPILRIENPNIKNLRIDVYETVKTMQDGYRKMRWFSFSILKTYKDKYSGQIKGSTYINETQIADVEELLIQLRGELSQLHTNKQSQVITENDPGDEI